MASLGRYRRIEEILRRVETGQFISDSFFDELYPKRLKLRSPRHYTPVEVAMRVGELLAPQSGERVLDVGSGAGKFTIAAALCGKGFFTGVDMDPSLCEVASELAKDFGLAGRTDFIHGDALALDWKVYSAFYFYNPFYELVSDFGIDDTLLDASMNKLEQSVRTVQNKLREMPSGTKVAILHGFGGGMPQGYRLIRSEDAGGDKLELWVKT